MEELSEVYPQSQVTLLEVKNWLSVYLALWVPILGTWYVLKLCLFPGGQVWVTSYPICIYLSCLFQEGLETFFPPPKITSQQWCPDNCSVALGTVAAGGWLKAYQRAEPRGR